MAKSDSPQTGIYKKQQTGRSATMVFDEDGHLDLTSGSVNLPGALSKGYIDIGPNIFYGRELASAEKMTSGTTAPTYFFGGLLLPDTTPALNLLSTADPIMFLSYASAVVDAIALAPIAIPADLSTGSVMTIELLGESVGSGTASDAKSAFDIGARFGVGDTKVGTTHPDFTTTPTWKGVDIASGDLTTNQLNIILTPAAHAGRAINLYGGRISYTKKTS